MTSRTFHLVAVALAAAGLIVVCSDARATILTADSGVNGHFDRLIPTSSVQGDSDTQMWRDNFGSTNDPTGMSSYNTPNVTVFWSDDDQVPGNGGTDHYYTVDEDGAAGAGTNVVFDWTPNDGCCGGPGWGPTLPVTFTADAGFQVRLDSMDIVAAGADIIVNVDGSDTTFTAPAVGALDLSGTGFGQVVSFHLAGAEGPIQAWAADNIAFSQQVPEPSSALLALVGLVTVLCGLRRRSA